MNLFEKNLFWEQGVDGTTGDQIAEAVGLSVRTIWRYFRNKESCAEPVVTQQSVEKFMACLRHWSREISLEDQLVAWEASRPRDPDQQAYDLEVRLHAVAATSVIRVINEDLSAALLSGADPASFDNLFERMARAVRVATGGVLGDPVEP